MDGNEFVYSAGDRAARRGRHRRRRGRRAVAGRVSRWLMAALLATAAVQALGVPSTREVALPQAQPATANLTTQPSPSPTPLVQDFDIMASGDLLIHSQLYQQALAAGHGTYDFRPELARIRPVIQGAALAICHVETPMGPGPPSGYPVFNTPSQLAAAIHWAGSDVCDTASNHTVDQGQAGVDATLRALDGAGVKHAGSASSAAQARRILVRGIKVAFLAYAYGTNGIPSPHPWSVNLISLPRVESDARRARRMGANLVIVNFHWGDEYLHTPSASQVQLATTLLRHHIVDAIVGQHVHVVQPIREIAGRFVVFGEGNLLSGQAFRPDVESGLVAVLHVHAVGTRASITGVDYIPTWVQKAGWVVLPIGATLSSLVAHGEGSSALAAELRASYRLTVSIVGSGRHIHPIPASLG